MAEEKTTPKVSEEQIDTQATATAEETTKKANYISPAQENPEKFLEEFNWENYKEGIEPIDEGKLDEFEKLVKDNFVDTLDDQLTTGTVINITDRDAIIDINAKSEGVISLNEFRYNPDLKVGDTVDVMIDVREDAEGQLILSHRKARTIKAWERVNDAHDDGTIVNGFVKCRTGQAVGAGPQA